MTETQKSVKRGKPPSRRGLLIGLVVSLVLNVFLGGVVFGRALGGKRGAGHRGEPTTAPPDLGGRGFSIRSAERTLGADVRPLARDIEERRLESLRPQFDKMRVAHQSVFAAVSAEPFDRAALEAALTDLRTRQAVTQSELNAGFVELVAELTPEQRKRLAEATPKLRHREKRGRRHRGD